MRIKFEMNLHLNKTLRAKPFAPITDARVFEMRSAAVAGGTPGPWQSGRLHTNSCSIPLNGQPSATYHQEQVRAIGGSACYSDLIDLVSHMSIRPQ